MATALRSGYVPSNSGPGVSGSSGSGAPAASSKPSMDDSFNNLSQTMASMTNSMSGMFADAMRTQYQFGRESSALSQSYAERQMDYQTQSDKYAMAWSANQAAQNRAWQEEMSNTAHQREVQDLIAAGLNPILSANGGASVGSGATGQAFTSSGAMGNVDMTSPLNIAQGFFSDLMNSALTMASLGIQSENAKLAADSGVRIAGINAGANMYASDNALLAAREGHSSDQFQTNLRNKSQERIAKWSNKIAEEGNKRKGFVGATIHSINDLANVSEGMMNEIGGTIKNWATRKVNDFNNHLRNLGGAGRSFD